MQLSKGEVLAFHNARRQAQRLRELEFDNSAFEMSCTPSYYFNEGGGAGAGPKSALGDPYSPGYYAFEDLLKEWRDKGDLDGLELST